METRASPYSSGAPLTPHSLGKPIEWKPALLSCELDQALGLPTRWGNQLNGNLLGPSRHPKDHFSPHSLGKPIEWKHLLRKVRCVVIYTQLPTRWGNQLNGNLPLYASLQCGNGKSPHSLGKPIEWKLETTSVSLVADNNLLPTRWGNQLNGNVHNEDPEAQQAMLPTRWGNQLNGNTAGTQPI